MAYGPGSWLTEDLELLELLATGAMGAVWVGWDHRRGQRVAIKLAVRGANSQRRDARFRREISVTAELDSAYVPRTFDGGVTEDGTPYLVMELLEGETLEQRLARDARLSLGDTAILIEQIADALDCVHCAYMVHRDVKPENIFLVDGYETIYAKLLDFGVAKPQPIREESSLTEAGAMVGTPEYMSPEQVMGDRDIDLRSDVWGLGVVVYRALTGKYPFARATPSALVLSICRAVYPPPTTVDPELPPAIDDWFKSVLCLRREGRFPSCGEMAAAFTRIAGS
jgi:serine/threonine protein kinase